VTLGPKGEIEQPVFASGQWGVGGIRLRE
jgi:hypothetical protein